jgi:hypothetical protein
MRFSSLWWRLAVVMVASAGAGSARLRAEPALTAEQQGWLGRAHRFERRGWIYVHVEGSAPALGFQHGHLLARSMPRWSTPPWPRA